LDPRRRPLHCWVGQKSKDSATLEARDVPERCRFRAMP
jgi:hypothetical protein